MNTWLVGTHPIGHHILPYSSGGKPSPILSRIPPNRLVRTSHEDVEREEYGEKVFFMKGRIMAGQADISKNELGGSDFQWLAKEEVQRVVSPGYWSSVRNMLAER